MGKKKKIANRCFVLLLLFIFVYFLSYSICYIRYDNGDVVQVKALLDENRILKNELLELGKVSFTEGILAKVVLRDLYSFYDVIVINVGSEDGVLKNSAVINEDGLIGIVSKVDKNRSYVNLLSSNYNVSIRVNDDYGNYNNGFVTMIDKYSDVKVGDIIYTSGLDNVTGGIYVGKVVGIKLDKDGLGKELKVEYLNNKNLNYVFIVGSLE